MRAGLDSNFGLASVAGTFSTFLSWEVLKNDIYNWSVIAGIKNCITTATNR